MQLKKSFNNTNVPLTLKEKTTIDNPVYLFEFRNDTTGVRYCQIFDDVSTPGDQRDRANLFNIEIINTGSGANKIILGNVGQYGYIIHQQSSPTNLNPDLAEGIVERGRMRLIDDETSIYIEHQIEIEYVAHEQ
ncbi:MAG: hypothetical protein ACRCYO_13375 [Bacteroidia bacterium]